MSQPYAGLNSLRTNLGIEMIIITDGRELLPDGPVNPPELSFITLVNRVAPQGATRTTLRVGHVQVVPAPIILIVTPVHVNCDSLFTESGIYM